MYCCLALSSGVPLSAFHASYFARPTKSPMPGRLPFTSPELPCLNNAYSLSKVELSGRSAKFLESACARSNCSAIDEARGCLSFVTTEPDRAVRPLRDRAAGPAVSARVEADESTLAEESDESAGVAHAVPRPPVATPIPTATAKPPTRPTYAATCISNCPSGFGHGTYTTGHDATHRVPTRAAVSAQSRIPRGPAAGGRYRVRPPSSSTSDGEQVHLRRLANSHVVVERELVGMRTDLDRHDLVLTLVGDIGLDQIRGEHPTLGQVVVILLEAVDHRSQ